MPHVNRLRVISATVAAGALTLGGFAMASAAQAAPRKDIAGTHPQWANASHRVSSPAVSSGTVSARVYLAGRNPAGLAGYATAVSTPGNALYRHFLSPAQVQAQYGTTAAQLSAVEAWLRGAGLTITGVSNHVAGGYVAVRGSAAAASKAFSVSFGAFKNAGAVVRAPEQAASAPASVAASVLTVTGLSTAKQTMRPAMATAGTSAGAAPGAHASKPAAAAPASGGKSVKVAGLPPAGPNFWVARPCAAYYGQKVATTKPVAYGKHQPYALCGYTPRQIRAAYGVTASHETGKGQTVAVVDAYAAPTMLKDANHYSKVVGDKPFRRGQYRQILPATFNSIDDCGAAGWYGEESLDVESVHGLAPDANVRYVGSASCNDDDFSDALAFIVNNHVASIVSNSWGSVEDQSLGTVDVYHLIFQAGAAEGIAFMFSSGDSGYEAPAEDPGSDKIQADYPTSDSFATSVGGTSLAVGKTSNYKFETSWGTMRLSLAKNGKNWASTPPGPYPDSYDGSGGGGTSTLFTQPAYQKGVVPNSLSQTLPGGAHSATKMRVVPDVSAYGDPATGFMYGETVLQPDGTTQAFSLSRIGGTSLSCPTFAGIEADAQEAAHGPLGFANPLLYAVSTADAKAFHDVTDHPLGPTPLAQVRTDYTDPSTKAKPLVFSLRTLGINGEGPEALHAVGGFDDATGVGSPWQFVQFVKAHG
ncbi:MAG TPA: S53 family serine peptidase [Streptosporangiaceae bacterium]